MPAAPQILPTQIPQGTAPGVSYRLEGELVPVLHMALDGQVPVYFEHHVLLWKYPQHADRPASAEEGAEAARVRRHAAADARGAVGR